MAAVGCIRLVMCPACEIGQHPEQRTVHDWADAADVSHALATGQDDPTGKPCNCWCSRPPQRIQRKRTKGWRMPDGAIYVGRPTLWGNPFAVGTRAALARVPAIAHPEQPWEYEGRISADGMRHDYHHNDGRVTIVNVRAMTIAECVECYRALLYGDGRWPVDFGHAGSYYPHIKRIEELRGRDLACWCPLDQPCHADVLLELANA